MTSACLIGSDVSVAEAILWVGLFVCIVSVIPVLMWSLNRWLK